MGEDKRAIQAKFRCTSVKLTEYNQEIADFTPVTVSANVPENERFHSATPSGSLSLTISNPSVLGFYKPGKSYYVTMTEADA